MSDSMTVDAPPDLLHRMIETSGPDLAMTLPHIRLFRTISDIRSAVDWPETIRLLTPESTASEVRQEFLTVTHVMDLVADGPLELRVVPGGTALQPLIVSETGLVSFVGIGNEELCAFRTDDEEAVARLGAQFDALWETAEEYAFRTPPYSLMLRTLGEELSEGTRRDVRSVLESPQTTRSVSESLDEVDVTLLMAARNGQQLYRIGRWGEDIGLASSAKFSRQKRKLENLGLIDTEKVKNGVGRPRQRLILSDDLAGLEPDEIVSAAKTICT